MKPSPRAKQRGFLLITVVLVLAVLAAMALMLSSSASLDNALVAKHAERANLGYAAEAGLAHAQWQLAQNTSCAGYTNLPDTAFDDYSYTASVNPSAGSPVSISAVGTLVANGATRTVTRSKVKAWQTPAAVILQPAAAEGKDALVTASKTDWNYGDYPALAVNQNSNRALLEFGLSDVPAAARIDSATLELYTEWSNGPVTVAAYRLTTPWVEGSCSGAVCSPNGVTWASADGTTSWATDGGDYAAVPESSVAAGATGVWHNWDVTKAAGLWHTDGTQNHGLVLIGAGSSDVEFASSDNGNAALHPKLTVTYTCECGSSGTTGTFEAQPGASGMDTYLANRQSGDATTNFGNSSEMRVSNNGGNALLKFDLSSIPVEAQIDSAELTLLFNDADAITTADFTVHEVTKDWIEGEATWNVYQTGLDWTFTGGDYNPTVEDATTINATTDTFYTWNITGLVSSWVAGSIANNGLTLLVSGSVTNARFASSDASIASKRPKLTVNYTCPCGVVCSGSGAPPSPPSGYFDEFNSMSCDLATDYSGSDGTLDWSGLQWQEQDDDDPCAPGNVWLLSHDGSNRLGIKGASSIKRQVDLSAFSGATLTFDYLQIGSFSGSKYLSIEVSGNGGSSWTELGQINAPGDGTYQSASYTIPPALVNANSAIRLRAKSLTGTRRIYIDNVNIVE